MKLNLDETLVDAIVDATYVGLSMTGIKPVPVGASSISNAQHELAVIVGLVGKNNGNVTINMSRAAMLLLAGRFMDEEQSDLDETNIDAIMELGNMLAGSVKEHLIGTSYGIERISLPSMIAGTGYNMMYARGITSVSVQFELSEMPVCSFGDRFFSTTVSILRGSGQ